MEDGRKTRMTGKDTVFRDIFSRKKYLLQMYKALHGRTLKAAKEIIRICRDRNLLQEYLSERETEAEGINKAQPLRECLSVKRLRFLKYNGIYMEI